MKTTFVYDAETDSWVPIEKRGPTEAKAPGVIQDTMDATWHPIDGKMYESKSQFRRTTRANGCYEVGNDEQNCSKRDNQADIKTDLLKSWEQLQSKR